MNGLKSDYSDRMNVEFVKTSTERGTKEPRKYELGRHGIVLLSPSDDILWKKKGHKISETEIRNGLNENLPE